LLLSELNKCRGWLRKCREDSPRSSEFRRAIAPFDKGSDTTPPLEFEYQDGHQSALSDVVINQDVDDFTEIL
jgi:hypothetical protein